MSHLHAVAGEADKLLEPKGLPKSDREGLLHSSFCFRDSPLLTSLSKEFLHLQLFPRPSARIYFPNSFDTKDFAQLSSHMLYRTQRLLTVEQPPNKSDLSMSVCCTNTTTMFTADQAVVYLSTKYLP